MEDIEGYFIKHDTHETTLIENIDKLRESCALVDCTLEVEGKYIQAHKVILAASSIFFANLFNEYPKEETLYKMKDVTFEELRATVDFIYRGEIVIPQEQFEKFIKTAKDFQIKGILETNNFNHSTENKNEVSQQSSKINQDNCQLENLSSEQLELDTSKKAPSIADEISQDLNLRFSLSEDTSSREGFQTPDLKRKILDDELCEPDTIFESNINLHHEEQLVPSLKLTPAINVISHFEKNMMQENFQSEDIPKENVDDFLLSEEFTETKDDFFIGSPCSKDLESSVYEKIKENVVDFGSSDVSQEELDSSALKVTHDTADAADAIGDVNQLTAESSSTQCIKTESIKTIILNKRASNKYSSGIHGRQKGGSFLCPRCKNTYKTKVSLRFHMQFVCGKEPQIQCHICQKKTKLIWNHIAHMKTHSKSQRVH